MFDRHLAHWPPGQPRTLELPRETVYANLAASAARQRERAAIDYYGRRIAYRDLKREVDALAGFLQQRCGVARGDRVLLYLQNSPQFVIGYYAILRADAVVVPVNPMNLTDELTHYVEDSRARVAIVGPDLLARLANLAPAPHAAGPDDLAVMPYTSGTTGKPKGCMHTHSSVQATTVPYLNWRGVQDGAVVLCALPMFHVTGMQAGMNSPIHLGATMVILSRWDRDCAAMQIERARVTNWSAITTMMVDFLSNPKLSSYDLSSLRVLGGGGAAMPGALAGKLEDVTGLPFVEGYGLSETMAPSHINPPQRPKRQCAGIPFFNTDARVIDVESLSELAPNQVGEIIVHGPQVFRGYWNQPEATAEAFLLHDGKRFFRTGDLGYYDEEGYFFITDRLKRMLNCAGFKVWPAEVEAMLYAHPAIQEACVIGARDAYRGETVKAVIVLKPQAKGAVLAQEIMEWARGKMAAFKVPRIVEFVDELPRTATGKILWRKLQEEENRK